MKRLSSDAVSSKYDDRLDKMEEDLNATSPSDPGGQIRPSRARYQSGDQTPASEAGDAPPPGPPGTLDIKSQIQKQQQLQQQQTAAAKARTSSAPTSPLKENKRASFFGKVTSFSQAVSAKVEQARDAAGHIRVPGMGRDKAFTLLVIDDANTDWSKYFRGRRLHGGEYDVRVEQAEFREMSIATSNEEGLIVSIIMPKVASKVVVRSFRPDFLLVRQHVKDANEDHHGLLLGFQHGNVPSVNSLESIHHFQDKPWVYGHLAQLQKKLGKDNFPLISQVFFANHHELTSYGNATYPCVLKVGHAHAGLGKIKIENSAGFEDAASLVGISGGYPYCTVEPFVDAKYDLHIQKIGSNYKAFMRKSLSGNWKANIGQSILEETPVTDRYKKWVDEVSELFGGLGICSVEAVVSKAGKEFIIEAHDSATVLLGEGQEEDRRNIADLVLKEMEDKCKPPQPEADAKGGPITPSAEAAKPEPQAPQAPSKPGAIATAARTVSKGSLLGEKASSVLALATSRATVASKAASGVAASEATAASPASSTSASAATPKPPPPPPPRPEPPSTVQNSIKNRRARSDSQASESSTASGSSSASSTVKKSEASPSKKKDAGKGAAGGASNDHVDEGNNVESEDTMKNLRKTFAGIFGEMGQ